MKQKIDQKIESKQKEAAEGPAKTNVDKNKVRTPEAAAAKSVNEDKKENHMGVPKKEELSKL